MLVADAERISGAVLSVESRKQGICRGMNRAANVAAKS